jgi:hypothetical protein
MLFYPSRNTNLSISELKASHSIDNQAVTRSLKTSLVKADELKEGFGNAIDAEV